MNINLLKEACLRLYLRGGFRALKWIAKKDMGRGLQTMPTRIFCFSICLYLIIIAGEPGGTDMFLLCQSQDFVVMGKEQGVQVIDSILS